MRSAWRTDTGLVRDNNEDFVLVDEANGIFLLADGMGGGPAGEVASRLAVTTSHDLLLRGLAMCPREGLGRLLADALAAAHSAIAKAAIQDPSLAGMGTTLEIVLVRDGESFVCHVGDSRIYLLRERTLRQLTTDDNYATAFARSENIPYERIPSRYRHILTQAVGVSDELVPEVFGLELKPKDLILVCSDGLNGSVTDHEIEEIILRNRTELDAITAVLIDAANGSGGSDNVSVIVIDPLWTSGGPLVAG